MSRTALQALPPLARAVVRLACDLGPADWATPSGCPGWSTQDVLIHLTCTFREMVDPDSMPVPQSDSIERSNDRAVTAFRGQTPNQTTADYERLTGPLLDLIAVQQSEPEASVELDFGDVGTYATNLMADSLVFDHYCHLRHDLGAPGRDALGTLASGEHDAVLQASTHWSIAGLPQMSPARLPHVLDAPVQLELTGPGGGTWTLVRRDGNGVVLVEGAADEAAARITSDTEAFIQWSTHRIAWYDANVTLDGDRLVAERVVSAIRVI